MAPLPSPKSHKDLPDDLLNQAILPRLPFKFLNRLKCISKNMHSLISTDTKFAADQSRLADTSSSGFMYMTDSGLVFFPDPTSIGIPDPSLNFLNATSKVKLVSSTNGLLLLYGEFSGKKSLCVCNPAIKEMAFVPYVVQAKNCGYRMGLAYDPCKFPDRYTIVVPLMNDHGDGILYQFNVFRSDTGKWTSSSQIYIGTWYGAMNAVYAKGVIYWDCGTVLMWYDTERDLAGSLTLPVVEGKVIQGRKDIKVYADEIICCRAWRSGIEVWRLNGGSCWDRLHATSLDDMVDAFGFCHDMQLCRKTRLDIFFKQCHIYPVGFDGRFVYIVMQRKYQNSTEAPDERLFCWEIETGRVEEKDIIPTNGRWCYCIFKYANSMARVPQILIGA